MLSDQERQDDEIFALQNILDENEFRCKRNTNIECSFSISSNLIKEHLVIKYDTAVKRKELRIRHLPPVRFYVQLPKNYPSTKAPKYHLAVNWLTPWQVSLICQKLDELWEENEFNEILFVWQKFLKNELSSFLDLKDTLDTSYLFELFLQPNNQFLLDVLEWRDSRVVYGGLDVNPIKRLLDYNELGDTLQFDNNIQECGICFTTHFGKMCYKVKPCDHVFCKDCAQQYLAMKINEHNVKDIKCPACDCKVSLQSSQIREICSDDLFEKYEKYLLEMKLIDGKNLVYCPRKVCQMPVTVKDGENLASCPSCEYNFCAYCFKVYHGIMPCDTNSEEQLELAREYEKSGAVAKKFLERKYGKHQIQQVEKQLTKNYLEENTKICPTCGILTAKTAGCNLMSCLHCHTNYCWLCNSKIESADTYEHFKTSTNGPCNGRLFEGVEESNEFIIDIDDFEDRDEFIANFDLFMNHNFQ